MHCQPYIAFDILVVVDTPREEGFKAIGTILGMIGAKRQASWDDGNNPASHELSTFAGQVSAT